MSATKFRFGIVVLACAALVISCASERTQGPGGSQWSPPDASGGGPGGRPPGERREAASTAAPSATAPSAARAGEAAVLPQSIATGPSGEVYVAQSSAQRVVRIDPTGVVTTVAGTGRKGFSGDGGPAVEAELSNPCAVAVDGFGNVYIADTSNSRVRKVDRTGIISTIAGKGTKGDLGDGGPAVMAQLSAPAGLALGSDGSLLIFDIGNGRLRRVSADGIITTVARLRVDSREQAPPGGN